MDYPKKSSYSKLIDNRMELWDGSLWAIADDSLIKAYGWIEGSPVIIKRREGEYEYNYIITNITIKKSVQVKRL